MKNQKKINRRNWLQLGIGATVGTISMKLNNCNGFIALTFNTAFAPDESIREFF